MCEAVGPSFESEAEGKGRSWLGTVRKNSGRQGGGLWLTVFMNGPIMSHQENGGHENMKADKG